jgi:hypothetical protein
MALLSWISDKPDPGTIVDAYAAMLVGLTGIEAWANLDAGRIHFFTILNENFQLEPAVYQAEQEMLNKFGPELVTFDVYADYGFLKYSFDGELQLVVRAV